MQDGKDIDSLIPYLNKNAINWIQIHGFQNTEVIQHVCQNFNVDFLTIQDILNSDHQTKIEPVSYTHLDVYKRQLYDIATINTFQSL